MASANYNRMGFKEEKADVKDTMIEEFTSPLVAELRANGGSVGGIIPLPRNVVLSDWRTLIYCPLWVYHICYRSAWLIVRLSHSSISSGGCVCRVDKNTVYYWRLDTHDQNA